MLTGTTTGPDGQAAFRILIVCTANICRSPMAEHLLRRRLSPAQAGPVVFEVSSAGTRGWVGAEMDPPAAAELRRLGGDPRDFRARSFRAALGEAADLILTATIEHRRLVLQEVPRALNRTFTLLEFAHLASHSRQVGEARGEPSEVVKRAAWARSAAGNAVLDLADPHGRSTDVHAKTADTLNVVCKVIAESLSISRIAESY